jgi:hypothetical protein
MLLWIRDTSPKSKEPSHSEYLVSIRDDGELLNLILVEPHMKRVSGRSQLTMYRPIRFVNLSLLTRDVIDEVDLYTTHWHHFDFTASFLLAHLKIHRNGSIQLAKLSVSCSSV